MKPPVSPIPAGYHSIHPYLTVRDAGRAIAFYKELFGAIEVVRLTFPGTDAVMHAELKFGDSIVMLGEEAPHMNVHSPLKFGGSPVSLMHYVADVDALFARAIAAGCTPIVPPADMFWGDRFGKFVDPFGHVWGVATHIADPTPEEMEAGAKAMAAGPDDAKP